MSDADAVVNGLLLAFPLLLPVAAASLVVRLRRSSGAVGAAAAVRVPRRRRDAAFPHSCSGRQRLASCCSR